MTNEEKIAMYRAAEHLAEAAEHLTAVSAGLAALKVSTKIRGQKIRAELEEISRELEAALNKIHNLMHISHPQNWRLLAQKDGVEVPPPPGDK
jgi:hypothetical protein